MSDRELLELAARACGWKPTGWGGERTLWAEDENGKTIAWTPLHDDGDALRLAVKLEICITYSVNDIKATFAKKWKRGEPEEEAEATERHRDDPMAATRRAIVLAAAELAKSMPSTKEDGKE